MFAELMMFLGIWLPLFEWYGNVLRSRIGVRRATFVGRSDKILNVDCGFTHLTTEWNIPYTEVRPVLTKIRAWLDRAQEDPLHRGVWPSMPLEIRFSKGDDIWLSPAHGRTSCWIGIVKYKYVLLPRCPCRSCFLPRGGVIYDVHDHLTY
jgi:L-gulonolactone oxidase